MRTPVALLGALALGLVTLGPLPAAAQAPAQILNLTDRQVEANGTLNVSAAQKLVAKLIQLDAQAEAPIFLTISSTDGTAQGVLLVADTIRSLRSPVVGVVVTQVHGPGAALAAFTDRIMMFPSSGLVFTELEYEGVKKPKAAKAGANGAAAESDVAAETNGEDVLLQKARQQYLDRFNAQLASRLNLKSAADLVRRMEAGYFVTPDEAVRQKVAHAVVDRITYATLPEEKREVKITTTDKRTRTVDPSPLLQGRRPN